VSLFNINEYNLGLITYRRLWHSLRSRDRAVDIATGYRLDDQGSEFEHR
jgi:hypothetical protein